MPYDPNEPRDNRGRWTASEVLYPNLPGENSNQPGKRYVSEEKPEDILKKADKDGYVSAGRDKGSHECAALVKAAIPQLGPASGWKKGADITGANDPNLQPGTAIGYGFAKDGSYPNNPHGQHVAIVGGAGKNGKTTIIEQWKGQRARERDMHPGEEKRWSVVTR